MTGLDTEATLTAMQALVCRDDLDITQRDASDLEFRRLYRLVTAEEDMLEYEVQEALKDALLALAGDDDWSAACAHMAEARRLFGLRSG